MKTLSVLSILLCFLFVPSIAQWSGNPHFNDELILDIQMLSSQHVVVCGSMGVARSSDSGTSWSSSDQFMPLADGGTMENLWFSSSIFYDVHFLDDQKGFAAGWSLINSCEIIIATSDGGQTWRVVFRGATNQEDPTLAITSMQFTSSLIGYASSFSGRLIKTVDGGNIWTVVNTGIASDIKAIQFFDNNTGVAISGEKLYSTTNGGQTWTEKGIGGVAEAFFFTSSQVGHVATENKMLKTTDGGTSWSELNMQMNVSAIHFVDSQTGYAAGNGIYKTTNGGQIWTLQQQNISGFTALHFINQSNGMAAGWDGELFATTNGGGNEIPDLTLSGFSPTQGLPGTILTIEGENLAYVHTVVIGDIIVPFRCADGKIYATVPSGVADEKTISISSLKETVSSAEKFSLIKTPNVYGFTPTFGTEGSPITISGNNFGTTSAVLFNNIPAVFTISNNSTIIASVPAGNAAGQIEVVTDFGSAKSYSSLYKYSSPVITSIEPSAGHRDSYIIIHGLDFEPSTVVKLNGVTVQLVSRSETEIRVSGLPADATSGKFSVENPAWISYSEDDFTIIEGSPSSSFSTITPDSGPAGELVTITGTDFYSLKKLFLNGTEVPFEVQSPSQLVAEIPMSSESGVIEGLGWSSEPATIAYTVLPGEPTPMITAIHPPAATIQSRVILEGKNFATMGEVLFNGERPQITYRLGLTKIVTDVPVHAETGYVTVDGINSNDVFTVIKNHCSPKHTGERTYRVEMLAIGNVIYENTNINACKSYFDITDRIVEGTQGLNLSLSSVTRACRETYPVNEFNHYVYIDWNDDQDFMDEGELAYSPATPRHGAPQFDEFQLPATAPASGNYRMRIFITPYFWLAENMNPCRAAEGLGTSIDVTLKMVNELTYGQPSFTAFHPATTTYGATLIVEGDALAFTEKVAIDNKNASFSFNSATGHLEVDVPEQTTGSEVVIITKGGSIRVKDQLTVIPTPRILEITPASDTIGAEVKLRLADYRSLPSITHVYFNDTEADFRVEFMDIVARIPEGATSGKIRLVNAFGHYYSETDYAVITTPSVDSFFPANGKMGDYILITGSDFIKITDVLFNGKPTRFLMISPTQISAQVPYGGSHGIVSVVNKKDTAHSEQSFTILPTDGSATFREIPSFNYDRLSWGEGGHSFDYNHDGYVDLVLGSQLPTLSPPDEYNIRMYESINIYKSNGDGSFSETDIHLKGYDRISSGDFNGDGWDDLVTEYPGGFQIHYNDADHKFITSKYIRLLPLNHDRWWNHEMPRLTKVLDFDHDGDLDIIVTGTSIGWLEQDNGNFTLRFIEVPLGEHAAPYAFDDLDKDGDIDMVAGKRVYFNTNGLYTLKYTLPAYEFRGMTILDYNADGYGDILAAASVYAQDHYQLYKNLNGSGFDKLPSFGGQQVTFKPENSGDVYNSGTTGALLYSWEDVYTGLSQGTFELKYFNLQPDDVPVLRESMSIKQQTGANQQWIDFENPAFLFDFDDDGNLDFFILQSGLKGWPRLFKNYTTTSNADPTPPTQLNATRVSDTEVLLSWNAGADDHTPVASLNYNVEVKDETTGKLKMVPLPQGTPYGNAGMNKSYRLIGMNPAHVYSFRVKTVDQGYRSSQFSVAKTFQLQTLSVPELTATATGTRSVTLSWTDNTTIEDGFIIEYKKTDQATYDLLANVNPNTTTFENTTLDCHTTYSFRIRAFNTFGFSDYSPAVNITTLPIAPFGITGNTSFCEGDSTKLTGSPNFINYTWNDGTRSQSAYTTTPGSFTLTASDAEGCETSANITVTRLARPMPQLARVNGKLVASGASSYQWHLDGEPFPYLSDQLLPAISGTYKVKSTNASGCWAFSNEVIYTVEQSNPPEQINAPDNLVSIAINSRTVALSWKDNSANEEGFIIEFKTQNETDFKVMVNVDANVTQHTATGLDCDTEYVFRVRAFKQNTYSAFSATATATTQAVSAPVITGENFICEGETLSLAASAGFAKYEWSNGAKTPTISITTGGRYSVTVQDTEGCARLGEKTVELRPIPQASLEFADGQLVASGGSSYEWFWNDKLQSTGGNTFSPEMEGDYRVRVTEKECSAFSETVTIVFTGIEDVSDVKVTVAPNPSSGEFTVKGIQRSTMIRIMNAFGREIPYKTVAIRDDEMTIDFRTEASGVYFLSIFSQEQTKRVRVVLVK